MGGGDQGVDGLEESRLLKLHIVGGKGGSAGSENEKNGEPWARDQLQAAASGEPAGFCPRAPRARARKIIGGMQGIRGDRADSYNRRGESFLRLFAFGLHFLPPGLGQ